MANISARDAIGATMFASVGQDGFAFGPAARYRRWIDSSASIELALGTPLVTNDDSPKVEPGSLFGLVKWNANDWIGVAARPELIHWRDLNCGTGTCSTSNQTRISLGVEVGRVPGLVMTLATAALGALIAGAAAAGSGN